MIDERRMRHIGLEACRNRRFESPRRSNSSGRCAWPDDVKLIRQVSPAEGQLRVCPHANGHPAIQRRICRQQPRIRSIGPAFSNLSDAHGNADGPEALSRREAPHDNRNVRRNVSGARHVDSGNDFVKLRELPVRIFKVPVQ